MHLLEVNIFVKSVKLIEKIYVCKTYYMIYTLRFAHKFFADLKVILFGKRNSSLSSSSHILNISAK